MGWRAVRRGFCIRDKRNHAPPPTLHIRRQYITEEQAWAGLVVETVRELEAQLPRSQQVRGAVVQALPNQDQLCFVAHALTSSPLTWLALLALFTTTQFALRLGYNLRARSTEFWARFVLPVVFVSVVLVAVMAFGVQQLQACVAHKSKWGLCIKDLTGVPEIKADDPKANVTCNGNQITLPITPAALLQVNGSALLNVSAITITACANATAAGSSAAPANQCAVCCDVVGGEGCGCFAFHRHGEAAPTAIERSSHLQAPCPLATRRPTGCLPWWWWLGRCCCLQWAGPSWRLLSSL